MKKALYLFIAALLVCSAGYAQNSFYYDSLTVTDASGKDSLEIFTYHTGTVGINNGVTPVATIKVPEGYKYLDTKQARYVMENIWGNPPQEGIQGLLMPVDRTPYEAETWAVTVFYDESGHVKDEDAKDIDYDDLLKDMQKETKEASEERVKMGYQAIELVGWATPPFYDEANHKLHWAKEIKFIGDSANTLNYNIRVLGKSGVLELNVIAGMNQLAEVNANLDNVLSSVNFDEAYAYNKFDPEFDKVAAYGIGGLIAGKVLAKIGFFALILKFWKLIAIAVIGAFAALRKKIFGKKEEEVAVETVATNPPASSDAPPANEADKIE
jgi:uncharacterized membrane-anchored protein